jgi:predicted permease
VVSFVTPAQAGVQKMFIFAWIPAFAGMTSLVGFGSEGSSKRNTKERPSQQNQDKKKPPEGGFFSTEGA